MRLLCMAADTESPCSTVTPDELWKTLVPKLGYLSEGARDLVKEALYVAFLAHNTQFRKSGEPFIIHPVEVCGILADMQMDSDTLIAGLLHDTVEDTDMVTFTQIQDQFGVVVRKIVEGETKVSKLGKVNRKGDKSEVKADDLKQMFLAMTGEIRVIIVKLADRLHNMRTLQHMSESKQKLISMETLEVFAPLAKLLGMYRIKEELEELSLKYMEKDAYHTILRRMDELSVQQEAVVVAAKERMEEILGVDPFIIMRTKKVTVETLNRSVYSIYKEAMADDIPFEDIRDVAVLRIKMDIDDTIANHSFYGTANQVCYHVLGMVHAMWTPLPERVKDFIAMPKPNGYRAIHTTVLPRDLGPPVIPLRLQIRTAEMDRVAEFGIIAEDGIMDSWKHNSHANGCEDFDTPSAVAAAAENPSAVAKRMAWLNAIQEWQDEFVGNMTAREFVDTITGDLLGSKVFVFTPKGEVVNLPKGATIIDYAYQIHSDVGNKMVAAKVDGKLRPPEYRLRNGEMVEIITYGEKPSRMQVQHHKDWLSFAKTRAAIHKITKFLRQNEHLLDNPGDIDYDELETDTRVYIDDNPDGGGVFNGEDEDDEAYAAPYSGPSPFGFSAPVELQENGHAVPSTAGAPDVRNGASAPDAAGDSNEGGQAKEGPTTVSLVLQCTDRDGLLQDVAGVISENGLSIRSYSGSFDRDSHTFYMSYEVSGMTYQINKVGNALRGVDGVRSYNLGWFMG